MPQGSIRLLSFIGSPTSPQLTFPFFLIVIDKILASIVGESPVVYEFIRKNSGLSDNID